MKACICLEILLNTSRSLKKAAKANPLRKGQICWVEVHLSQAQKRRACTAGVMVPAHL